MRTMKLEQNCQWLSSWTRIWCNWQELYRQLPTLFEVDVVFPFLFSDNCGGTFTSALTSSFRLFACTGFWQMYVSYTHNNWGPASWAKPVWENEKTNKQSSLTWRPFSQIGPLKSSFNSIHFAENNSNHQRDYDDSFWETKHHRLMCLKWCFHRQF